MPLVTVRRATLQDYQGVLDIGIMYDGWDYLPFFYKQYVTDPDYLCYVCEVDGEIVGFECVLLHDAGRALQGRAGRTKLAHRGRGYTKVIGQQRNRDTAHLTSAEFTIFVKVRGSTDITTITPPLFVIDTPILYKFPILKSRCMNFTSASSVNRMYKDDLQALLENASVCHRLFPRAIVYVSHLALGLDKTNIRHIINDNTRVFSSSVTSDASAGTGTLASIGLLTIGLHYECSGTPICSISVFGDDMDIFDAHVEAQIEEIRSAGNVIKLQFYTAGNLPGEVIKRLFRKYGTNSNDDFHEYPMCTYRGILETGRLEAKY